MRTMHYTTLLTSIALASLAKAQWLSNIPGIPSCAKACSQKLPAECGLVPTAQCICSHIDWMNSAQCCVKAACSASDLALTEQIAQGVCDYAKIALRQPTNCPTSTLITATPAPTPTGNPTAIAGYVYQGCWTEGATGNALAPGSYNMNLLQSLEACSSFCTMKKMSYMGLRNWNECFCANHAPVDNSTKLPDESTCNIPCSGNKYEICGGKHSIGVWKKP